MAIGSECKNRAIYEDNVLVGYAVALVQPAPGPKLSGYAISPTTTSTVAQNATPGFLRSEVICPSRVRARRDARFLCGFFDLLYSPLAGPKRRREGDLRYDLFHEVLSLGELPVLDVHLPIRSALAGAFRISDRRGESTDRP